MREQLDRILTHPREYDAVIQAVRRRITWDHLMKRVRERATGRFGIAW